MTEWLAYENYIRAAVTTFWRSGREAEEAGKKRGTGDRGKRSKVTAGKNMAGFVDLIQAVARQNGLSPQDVYFTKGQSRLPGFFRAMKEWDVLIVHENKLIAALEFKSQAGSFGKNQNNRIEEVIGAARDFWAAYEHEVFGKNIQPPFLGYLFLLEDCDETRRILRNPKPTYEILGDFQDSSYADRYGILGARMVAEKLYSAATILMSVADSNGDYSEMARATPIKDFVDLLGVHIKTSLKQ